MTGEQKSKAMELKATIATTWGMVSGAPIEVREEVVGLKKEVQRGGTTARELAKVLGLHESTLCRWEREVRALGGPTARGRAAASFRMVKVAVADSAERGSGSMSPIGGLRVAHAPSGLVIDGLDVESLAALLQRMS
jgi:hypothetical protein